MKDDKFTIRGRISFGGEVDVDVDDEDGDGESYGSAEDEEGVESRVRGKGLLVGGVWVMAEEGEDGDWRSTEEEEV
ncbi:hypothetical protein TIFTF001_007594 [Ficus carica]|uniref:Uncharacterized protein n=1 Tax=Ficus carica TaxID=3494 RepID=A0AA87ZRY8_FICCA|nr:hypothetical protein TIFTF001_007594 [Ficus carica]